MRPDGLDVGVINARGSPSPWIATRWCDAVEDSGFVITVEESSLWGGFGSAVLECVNAAGLPTDRIQCLGIPDRFIEHGERDELLADLGLDVDGLVATAQTLADP